jgi:hypothetical protein
MTHLTSQHVTWLILEPEQFGQLIKNIVNWTYCVMHLRIIQDR